jgi:hypothetical protein
MDYNNKLEPIRMPEYGRHVQRMVDFALGIEDRTRRNQVAHSIVQTMRGLAPSMADGVSDHVYWDHLAMISNFTLDVDYPEGTITKERFNIKVERPQYTQNRIAYRYYGRIIEDMIKRACEMPMGAERAALEYFIAVQMKRGYMTWNSEVVDDLKIFKDLYELSQGEIMLTPENCKIVLNPNSIDKGGKQKVVKKSTIKFQARPVVKNKRK